MNILQCRIMEESGQAALLIGETLTDEAYIAVEESFQFPESGGCRIYLNGALSECLLSRYKGKEVIMGIRPEDICEYEEAVSEGYASACTGMETQVKVREMLGAEVILHFEEQGKMLTAKLGPENGSQVGDTVKLYFNPEKIHIFDKDTEENVLY